MVTTDKYITLEETARRLNLSRHTVYAAVKNGRLRPIKRGRRNFFSDAEIDRYRNAVKKRWPSKQEAILLYEAIPVRPYNDQGEPLIEERRWDIFVAYASEDDATYDTVGEQFHISRQRVQQIIAAVVETLAEVHSL